MANRRFSYGELALLAMAFACYGAQVVGSISDPGTEAPGGQFQRPARAG